MQHECRQCHRRGYNFSACGGCFEEFYCGIECQRAHWQSHHRFFCDKNVGKRERAEIRANALEDTDLTCQVCLGRLRVPVRTLGCLHVFCSECVEAMSNYAVKPTCITCRALMPSSVAPQAEHEYVKGVLLMMRAERRKADAVQGPQHGEVLMHYDRGIENAFRKSIALQPSALAHFALGVTLEKNKDVSCPKQAIERILSRSGHPPPHADYPGRATVPPRHRTRSPFARCLLPTRAMP